MTKKQVNPDLSDVPNRLVERSLPRSLSHPAWHREGAKRSSSRFRLQPVADLACMKTALQRMPRLICAHQMTAGGHPPVTGRPPV